MLNGIRFCLILVHRQINAPIQCNQRSFWCKTRGRRNSKTSKTL